MMSLNDVIIVSAMISCAGFVRRFFNTANKLIHYKLQGRPRQSRPSECCKMDSVTLTSDLKFNTHINNVMYSER